MRKLAWVLSLLVVALGAIHLSLTPGNYPSPDLDMVWFIGTGMALVFAGLLNMVALRVPSEDRLVRLLIIGVNGLCAVGFALSWLLLKGPQVIAGVALFAVLAVATVLRP